MKVKLTCDLNVENHHLAAGQVVEFGEDSAKLLIRKGQAIEQTEKHTNKHERSDSGGGGQRKHSGRKKSPKG